MFLVRVRSCIVTGTFVAGLMFAPSGAAAGEPGKLAAMKVMETPKGTRFGLFGAKSEKPAPTLFMFALAVDDMAKQGAYTEVGRLLAPYGFLVATLDPPCHGMDRKMGEPAALSGWRARVEKGDNFVAPFTAGASDVLDYLVKEGYTDPGHVAACGISRGGFLAYHFAAAEPRVRAVAGISPVTTLGALSEFKGVETKETTLSFDLRHLAPKLAGRSAWLSIGVNDARVSTEACIAFSRSLVAAHLGRGETKIAPPVELIVGPSLGHGSIARAYERAAAWILENTTKKK